MGVTPVSDVRELNRDAWDAQVAKKNRWTVPVSPKEIEAARRGEWEILLTPTRPVPRSWFPELEGARVLCLASGGGQQGPILAATGARVTVFDNSPRQLAQDRLVAERENLELETIEGDMADLGVFADGVFDLIVHPVSNCFVPDLRPIWSECSGSCASVASFSLVFATRCAISSRTTSRAIRSIFPWRRRFHTPISSH
jgi:SAM-dependent methyltransferase